MKKTFKTLIVLLAAATLIVSVVLAFNVQLNLKIRRKVFELTHDYVDAPIEAGVGFLEKEGLVLSEDSATLMALKDQTGTSYFDAQWLKVGNTTALYDEKLGGLSVVGPGFELWIEDDGTATLDGEALGITIDFKAQDGRVYLPYETLSAQPFFEKTGLKKLPYEDGGHIIFYSDYIGYAVYTVAGKTPLFDTPEALEAYQSTLYQYAPFIELKKVFQKVPVTGVAKDEEVMVFASEGQPTYAVTSDGESGYIGAVDEAYLVQNPPAMQHDLSPRYDEPILMAWEAVYSYNPDTTKIPDMRGVNVVSPTWYELTDEKGNVSSKASVPYLEWAEQKGYAVWALVTNAFDIDRTHAFLYDKSARTQFIDYMIAEAKYYGYEGINIDFEHIYKADKDALTHFVNEFALKAKRENLILSMDVTIMGGSDNWSKCYDHEALGSIVDYLIVMTYNEHWLGSPVSGPVASYNWVEKSINALLEVVDARKLVMGVPLYTHVWREYPSTEKPNQYTNKSAAVGMEAQNNLIEKNNVKLIWDDVRKLYYGTYFEEGAQVKIWVENAVTLKEKAKIAKQNGLAGIAGWERGLETNDVWGAMADVLVK